MIIKVRDTMFCLRMKRLGTIIGGSAIGQHGITDQAQYTLSSLLNSVNYILGSF